jgi:hypothetical protein
MTIMTPLLASQLRNFRRQFLLALAQRVKNIFPNPSQQPEVRNNPRHASSGRLSNRPRPKPELETDTPLC